MLADSVKATFPEGVALPAPIRALCDFLDANGYPLSGCFEISTRGQDDMAEWFPDDAAMQRQFAVFGRGSTGSVYALWLLPGKDSDNSPVIVLGSEGDFLVLAVNAWEFCRLLGCGYEELEWDDLEQPSPKYQEAQPLRDWLKKHLSMECPTIGAAIVSTANANYPGFSEFIRQWQDENLEAEH